MISYTISNREARHADYQALSQESSSFLAPLSYSSSRPETVTATPTELSSNIIHPRNNLSSPSASPNLLHSLFHSIPNLPRPMPSTIMADYPCPKLFMLRPADITGRQDRSSRMTGSGSDRWGWYGTSLAWNGFTEMRSADDILPQL